MNINASNAELMEVPTRLIDRNPENPRTLFRPAELESLLESIRLYGIQVPISVYKQGHRFVLIDGERRWRCCKKLGRSTIPALVQEEPSPITNLLLMFNIHALREQWDLLTIAMKLPRVISLLEREFKRQPNERELSLRTGLARGTIRRCKLLMELPQHYKDEVIEELKLPKAQQKLTEDFFIEMERALKTVERALPNVISEKERVRRTLIQKYRKGIIPNRVHFRMLAKIARAQRVSVPENVARRELSKVFEDNNYSIERAYGRSVSNAYAERDLETRIDGLIGDLGEFSSGDLDDHLKGKLRELLQIIQQLLS